MSYVTCHVMSPIRIESEREKKCLCLIFTVVLARIDVIHKKYTQRHDTHCLSFTLARHLTEQVKSLTKKRIKRRTRLFNYSTLYTPVQRAWIGAQLSRVHFIPENPEPTLSLCMSLNTVLSWQSESEGEKNSPGRLAGQSFWQDDSLNFV